MIVAVAIYYKKKTEKKTHASTFKTTLVTTPIK